MGRGTDEDGGGPLRGGLVLMNRFTADTYRRAARGWPSLIFPEPERPRRRRYGRWLLVVTRLTCAYLLFDGLSSSC